MEEDFIILGLVILIAKFYICECKLNSVNLSLRVYKAKNIQDMRIKSTILFSMVGTEDFLMDTRAMTGANATLGHHMVVGKVRLKDMQHKDEEEGEDHLRRNEASKSLCQRVSWR